MSAYTVNNESSLYQDQWSLILLDSVKNKKVKRLKNLFDTLINGADISLVDDCWFEFLDSHPSHLDARNKSEMICTVFNWIYLFVNEKIKIKKVAVKELLTFLVKCKLHIFVSSVLQYSDNQTVFDDKNIFLSLFIIKEVLKLQSLKETSHTKELLEHSVIENLIQIIIKWNRPKLINVAAIDILFCFCMEHREACERIMDIEGHESLALFILKDWSEKSFINRGKFEDFTKFGNKDMVYKVFQVEGWSSIEDTHWKLPNDIDYEIAFPLLISGFYAKVFALKIFTQIANMNNRYRMKLYESLDVRKPVLGWLSTPSLGPSVQMIMQLASYVLYNLMLSEDITKKLVNETNLLDILDTGLFNPSWHISRQYQMLVFAVAKHGGTLRDALLKNKSIFEALVNQLYSIDEDVTPRLMHLIEELSKGCKTANELYQSGFNPKLLINNGHFYAHSYHMDQIRTGFQKYVGGWRAEEQKAIDNSKHSDKIVDNRQNVDFLKRLGNDELKKKNYSKALQLYSEAIDRCSLRIKCPDGKDCPSWKKDLGENVFHWWVEPATLFASRAQCYLKLKNWKAAVSEASKAICACWIPSTEGAPHREKIFIKATYRRAKAWFELKDYLKALNDISCVCELASDNPLFKAFYKEVLLVHRKFKRRELVRHCGNCGAGEGIKLRRCAECYETYCSKICQSKDWVNHKHLCKMLKNRKD
ncbi:uncharacterized protein LOC101238502 isoform X3 [Hydra vulgaris]|uniref:Uncharacterized protein LOC101238502 isoform X3 n=1 Tax=Hydra vulgaris TaxID=6087 RepID=A0ABM4CR57_HYDVU